MQNNNKHIKTGFKIPDNYFNKFENKLFDELKLNSETGFSVPKDYFANASDKIIMDNLKPIPVITLFSRKNIMYTSSIAAALVLGFFILFPKENKLNFDDVTYASLMEYSSDEFTNSYEIIVLSEMNNDDLKGLSEIPVDDNILLEYLYENDSIEINDNNL